MNKLNETEIAELQAQLAAMSLNEIANKITLDYARNRKPIYFGAVPYVNALACLDTITDNYGADSGRMIVAYLLGNLTTWRGDVARLVKAELNKRLKAKS